VDPTIKTLAGFGVNAIEDNFGEHAVKSKFRAAIKPKTIIYHTNLRSFLFIIAPLFYVVVYAIKTLQSYPVVTVKIKGLHVTPSDVTVISQFAVFHSDGLGIFNFFHNKTSHAICFHLSPLI
jgi:hypothetical protein